MIPGILYIGFNRWDSIWHRPHQLAHHLSQFFPVLYIDPIAYSIPGFIRNHLFGNRSRNLTPQLRQIHPNLTIFTPPPLLPFAMDTFLANYLDHLALGIMIKYLLKRIHLQHPVLWLTHPTQYPLLGRFNEILRCYDCMDNYSAFYPENSSRSKLVTKLEQQLLSSVDCVITTASSLQQKLQSRHSKVYLVRNAVSDNFINYLPSSNNLSHFPSYFQQKPVLGYIGTISHWLDFDAITRLAVEHPDWPIVFIGPIEIDLTPFKKFDNIHFLGSRPHTLLPEYVNKFDIGLIPFRKNNLTLDVNPVKIYEYFALGKPVVATRLPELETFSDLLYLADSSATFLQQVERAVYDLSQYGQEARREKRRQIAQMNTWQHRTHQIITILHSQIETK